MECDKQNKSYNAYRFSLMINGTTNFVSPEDVLHTQAHVINVEFCPLLNVKIYTYFVIFLFIDKLNIFHQG